nr:hypothetical protein [Gemmatimonadaceae bacterium]
SVASGAGAASPGRAPRTGVAAPRPAGGGTARPYVPPNAPPTYRPPRPSVGPLGTRPTSGALPARIVRNAVLGVGAFCAVAVAIFIVVGPRRTLGTVGGDRPELATASGLPAAAPEASLGAPAAPTAPAAATASSASPVASPVASPGRSGAAAKANGAPIPRVRTPDAVALGVPVMPQALPGVTAGALPASAADSSRLVFVRPPLRASTTPVAPPAGPPSNAPRPAPAERPGLGLRNVGTGTLDRVVKRNGEVLAGRVEIVRASEVQFLDAESRLRLAIPKREIREIITEFGTRVRFDAEAATAPAVVAMGPLVRRGVGGTYAVSYRVARVEGSPECRGLWRTPPADDQLIIVHVPGADTLSIRADNGGTFSAVIDPGANFATSLLPQPEASVGSSAITSRMSGRFTAEGFVGEVNIIGYRRQPTGRDISCYSTLTAYGRKNAR